MEVTQSTQGSTENSLGLSKNKKRRTATYVCKSCNYTSNRKFNISRHEKRIHGILKKARICCNLKFYTKCQYYFHCESLHPQTKGKAIKGRNPFMFEDKDKSKENEKATTNTNEKLVQNTETENMCLQEQLRISDTPKHRMPIKIELFKKKKLKKSLTPRKLNFKKEEEKNCTDNLCHEKESLDIECNNLKVTFSSIDDVNTLTKLQTQYLEDIDFDSFRISEKDKEPTFTVNLCHEKESLDIECNNLKVTFSSIDDVNTLTKLQTQYLEDIDFDSIPRL